MRMDNILATMDLGGGLCLANWYVSPDFLDDVAEKFQDFLVVREYKFKTSFQD